MCQVYRDKEYDDVAIFSAFLDHKLYFTVSLEYTALVSLDLVHLATEKECEGVFSTTLVVIFRPNLY